MPPALFLPSNLGLRFCDTAIVWLTYLLQQRFTADENIIVAVWRRYKFRESKIYKPNQLISEYRHFA